MTASPPVVAVVGPTATGKTALAVELARRLGGQVVNADSMQLYRGMDIGTAKPDATTDACAALGAELAEEPVGLLVVGDGAAMHTAKAPGHLDERSGPFDDAVAAALRDADPAGLAALDPDLARELWAIGRAPWQVLAGAAAGRAWTGELLYTGAPFGVGYHVAVWVPCPD